MSSFDFFPKVEDSLSERTLGGALVSVLSFAFVIWAGAHELSKLQAGSGQWAMPRIYFITSLIL